MKRTVVSVSVSTRNRDAVIVAQALEDAGIPLTYGGGQILAWAAAYLTAPAPLLSELLPSTDEIFGMSTSELDDCLDDF